MNYMEAIKYNLVEGSNSLIKVFDDDVTRKGKVGHIYKGFCSILMSIAGSLFVIARAAHVEDDEEEVESKNPEEESRPHQHGTYL